MTVLNGMSEKQENVFNQINYITKLLPSSQKPNVETIFIDSSENMKKYVIDSAKEDHKIISAPAICSGCKIVMEKEIWNYLLNRKTSFCEKLFRKKPPILMGYTVNQRNQSWMEQSTLQIGTMENEGKKYGIKVVSPFFDVIEEPYDSTLLLASLGIPLKNHKSEMKCLASGLNPQKLDIQTQRVFTDLKNRQTIDIPKDKGLLVYYNPNEILKTRVDLSKDIQELKRNENFLQGAYKE